MVITTIGMAIGAFGGAQVARLAQRQMTPLVATLTQPNSSEEEETHRYMLFEQPTRLLDSTNAIFIPLNIFNEKLRYDVEFKAMKQVIRALDDMYYYENVMHGAKAEVFPNQVRFAEAARSAALKQLHSIVEFGDKVIPSQTRREDMMVEVNKITEITDQVILSMQSIMASTIP